MYASPAGKCGQSGRARAQVQAGRQAGGQASKQPSIRVTSGSKRDAGGGQAGCRMLVVMRSLLSERPRTIGKVGRYIPEVCTDRRKQDRRRSSGDDDCGRII